jgi:hypothetical protein
MEATYSSETSVDFQRTTRRYYVYPRLQKSSLITHWKLVHSPLLFVDTQPEYIISDGWCLDELFILRFFGHCISRTLTTLASCLLNGIHPFFMLVCLEHPFLVMQVLFAVNECNWTLRSCPHSYGTFWTKVVCIKMAVLHYSPVHIMASLYSVLLYPDKVG